MQTNLLWKGIEYDSIENCSVSTTDLNNDIHSTIVGHYQYKIYSVNYHIKTDVNWLPFELNFTSTINSDQFNFVLKKDEYSNWILNDEKIPAFSNCFYLDISVTPFTNTLPINHLQLSLNQQQQIDVIYINIFGKEIRPLQQLYKKVSRKEYLYQNIPNDFEAIITIDESGFVVDYPQLFKRTAVLKSN